MSSLTQFTVTGKEKDDFYGIHITGMSNQEIKRTITKSITGKERNQHLYEYALSTAYDASTLSFTGAKSLVRVTGAETQTDGIYTTAQKGLSTLEGFTFNNDGTKAYAVDSFHARIIQYALSTGYDVTTLTYTKELSIAARGKTPVSITFNNDGSKLYIIENGGNAEQEIAAAAN
jgi:DNA-binding beta-propeller fold protein YncE